MSDTTNTPDIAATLKRLDWLHPRRTTYARDDTEDWDWYIGQDYPLLRAHIATLTAERDKWKAAHDEMVDRNKLLRNRPDLPIERVRGYDEIMARMSTLTAECEKWRDLYEGQVTRNQETRERLAEVEGERDELKAWKERAIGYGICDTGDTYSVEWETNPEKLIHDVACFAVDVDRYFAAIAATSK